MDMYIFMGICEELKLEGKDLSKYKLKDIKTIYKSYAR